MRLWVQSCFTLRRCFGGCSANLTNLCKCWQQVLWAFDILAMFIFMSSSVHPQCSHWTFWGVWGANSPFTGLLSGLCFRWISRLMNICFLLAFLHQMSAELHCDARIQSTTVGGSKPLHYFMKGQPKITGVRAWVWFRSLKSGSCVWFWLLKSGLCVWFWSQSALLVLGCSFFIICVTVVRESSHHMWTVFPPGVLLGIMVGCFSKTLQF